jgi:hypothetical protein
LLLLLLVLVLVLVLDGCLNHSGLPLFDRIGHRGAIVQRPIKELLKLSHAGFDWVCHRANSLGRFVAHRVRISVASDAP